MLVIVNLQLGTAGEDPEKKFSSDEELSEKLGEVLFALCRFCAKYKVSGEMALLKKLEEFWLPQAGGKTLLTGEDTLFEWLQSHFRSYEE